MPRYATIITGDDGREIVSAIGEFEGAAPQVRLGRVEQVAPGVRIGMVRDAAGGFCFEQPGVSGNAVSLAMARLKARVVAPVAAAKPKRAKRAKKKNRSRKQAGSMPKAGKAASVAAAKAMGQVDG